MLVNFFNRIYPSRFKNYWNKIKNSKNFDNDIKNITNIFYFSIWNKTKNFHSRTILKKTERLNFEQEDYLIPKNWTNTFKENLLFPSNQLGLGYSIK